MIMMVMMMVMMLMMIMMAQLRTPSPLVRSPPRWRRGLPALARVSSRLTISFNQLDAVSVNSDDDDDNGVYDGDDEDDGVDDNGDDERST